jgi:hypothetical protein
MIPVVDSVYICPNLFSSFAGSGTFPYAAKNSFRMSLVALSAPNTPHITIHDLESPSSCEPYWLLIVNATPRREGLLLRGTCKMRIYLIGSNGTESWRRRAQRKGSAHVPVSRRVPSTSKITAETWCAATMVKASERGAAGVARSGWAGWGGRGKAARWI